MRVRVGKRTARTQNAEAPCSRTRRIGAPSTRMARRGPVRHAVAGVSAVLLGAGLVVAGGQASASAAECTGVSAWSDLATAFGNGGTVTLCQTITADPGEHLTIGTTPVTLDLNGFDLTVTDPGTFNAAIAVTSGHTLTITDTSTGTPGTLTATGGFNAAGIGGGNEADGGAVTINGGTVAATGGYDGAGIGGGNKAGGGAVTISGGTVTATGGDGGAGIGGGWNGGDGGAVTITDGTVTATSGGDGAAGIGGGWLGDGGAVTIDGGTVTATDGGDNSSAIGGGFTGAFGSLSNAGTLVIPSGAVLTVPSGISVTNDGTIQGSGMVGGSGAIVNGGAIWQTLTVGDGVTITDHHYQVSFDPNGGGLDWNDGPWSIMNGPTLASVGRDVDDLPAASRDGYTFTGWYGDVTASGSPVDATTVLSEDSSTDGTPVGVTLYAAWELQPDGPYYAYPDGGATAPASCPAVTDLAQGCTLTQALGLARDGDTVILAANPGTGTTATFTTDTGWTVAQDSLTIRPDTGVDAVLDGNATTPIVLDYTGVGTLTVDQMTVANSAGSTGLSSPGGGIVNHKNGTLKVTGSTFIANGSPNGYGGGILNWNAGRVSVTGSTFTNDPTAPVVGNGIQNVSTGPITVTDSTFSASGDTQPYGSIYARGGGPVTVIASTFLGQGHTGNATINTLAGKVRLAGSIVAGSDTACSVDPKNTGGIVDAGYNIAADDSCGFTEASSISSEHLAGSLNPLAGNGGPTLTAAPQQESPAAGMIPVDASVTIGADTVTLCPTTDQRGVASVAGVACNAGSVQNFQPLTITTTALPDGIVGADYHQALVASGAADGVYHWSVAVGALPDGLHLSDDGLISGKPTTAGAFAFTVSVNDPVTAELSIVVQPTAGAPAPGSTGNTGSDSVTAPAGGSTPGTTANPAPQSNTTSLAQTGTNTGHELGIAAILLAAGLALLLAGRSRRSRRPGR